MVCCVYARRCDNFIEIIFSMVRFLGKCKSPKPTQDAETLKQPISMQVIGGITCEIDSVA